MNILIAGGGDVGKYLVTRLVAEQHDITIIDRREEVLENLAEQCDIRTVVGNSSSLESLLDAGVETADLIIAATDSDETNLITCLLANSVNKECRKIARVRELIAKDSRMEAAFSDVFDGFINSYLEAASYILKLFDVPGAVEVIDLVDGRVRIAGIRVDEMSDIVGKKLREVVVKAPMLVVAIAREDGLIIPTGEDVVQDGDVLYIITESQNTDAIFTSVGVFRPAFRNVMIFGGNIAGRTIAQHVAKKGCKVTLIDRREERCQELANALNDVLVLYGDGTDQELLEQEGIADVDLFIGVTKDEEENILSALLAKRLGAKAAAVFVAKEGYMNLVSTIGIEIVVSPRIVAAASILKFVRKGSVSSAFSTRDDTAEIIEAVVDEKSKIISRPIMDINWPAGVIVASIVHENSVTIPRGDTVIQPGDHVIFFANREALPKLENLLDKRQWLF